VAAHCSAIQPSLSHQVTQVLLEERIELLALDGVEAADIAPNTSGFRCLDEEPHSAYNAVTSWAGSMSIIKQALHTRSTLIMPKK